MWDFKLLYGSISGAFVSKLLLFRNNTHTGLGVSSHIQRQMVFYSAEQKSYWLLCATKSMQA